MEKTTRKNLVMDIEERMTLLEVTLQEFICTVDQRLSSLERQISEIKNNHSLNTSVNLSESVEQSLKNIIPKVDAILSKNGNTTHVKSVTSKSTLNSVTGSTSNGILTVKEREKCFVEAARGGYKEKLEALINTGVDLNTKDAIGYTALIQASLFGHSECVSFLVESGADMYAKKSGMNALHVASSKGHVQCVRVLLDAGIHVDSFTSRKETPLMLAASEGRSETVSLLLLRGADRHVKDDNGRNVLHVASYKGHVQCVRVLLDAGFDVHSRTKTKATPLILAAKEGFSEIVSILLKRGANKEAEDESGINARKYASEFNHTQCVRLLDGELI